MKTQNQKQLIKLAGLGIILSTVAINTNLAQNEQKISSKKMLPVDNSFVLARPVIKSNDIDANTLSYTLHTRPRQVPVSTNQPVQQLAGSVLPFTCGKAPIGLPDNYAIENNKTLTVDAPGLRSNDIDPDGGTFIVSNYFPPTHGQLTSIVTNGSFIYVPEDGFTGTDQFSYILLDNDNNLSEPVTVTINVVAPFNRRPLGVNDHYGVVAGNTLTVAAPGLRTNDIDPDGDPIIVSNFFPASHGQITSIVTNGSFVYIPDAGFTGTDQFSYILADDKGLFSDQVTVTISVVAAGTKPVGMPDNFITEKGKTLTVTAPGLLSNDFDPDAGTIIVSNFLPPSHGQLTSIVTNGSFIYVPEPGFTGTDQFTYTLLDNDNNFSDPVTVSIEVVEPFNRQPVGVEDYYAVMAGNTLTIAAPGLLTNDIDPDGDAIIVSNYFPPSHGQLTSIVTNGSFVYVPDAGFTGTDQFRYTILDNKGLFSEQVTVNIVVVGVNLPPVAVANNVTVECTGPNGTSVILDGSGSYDPEAGGLVYTWYQNGSILAGPSNSATSEVVFATGTHQVTLKVEDECGESSETGITVTVQDLTPPTVEANFVTNVLPHQYIVSCSVSDICSDDIAVTSVILVPQLANASVTLENSSFWAFEIDEMKKTIKVQAPDASAFWASIQANQGIVVKEGQEIEVKTSNGKYNYEFDAAGNLVAVRGGIGTLRCIANDGLGNIAVSEQSIISKGYGQGPKASKNLAKENPLTTHQNYPNPFRDLTTIQLVLAEQTRVTVSIFDQAGRQLEVLMNGQMPAGQHNISWDARKYQPGVYYYRIQLNGSQVYRKMLRL